MRLALAIAVAALTGSPVLACINDSELMNHEREFRSQYQESQYEPPQPEPVSSARSYVLGGTGILLGVVGAGMVLRLRANPR